MPVIPTVSGGISLLSSSLMPYRTLLTSCDDMNIYVVPLYRPHGGKNENGVSEFSDSAKRAKTCNAPQGRENMSTGKHASGTKRGKARINQVTFGFSFQSF